jgi:hypothetical protein
MIHLNTLVGGRNVSTLRPMLAHYQKLGVQSFLINVHLSRKGDPILDEVREITKDFGVPIAAVMVGNWLRILRRTYRESREAYPKDWHILADQDELQIYPFELTQIERMCEQREFDYVCGCWVDRLTADGSFPRVDPTLSIWEQFPMGAFLSYPIAAADPRKVVLAKSNVDVCVGQHLALNGKGCSIRDMLVQVHHFKWTDGIVQELEVRAELLKEHGYEFHVESARFAKYLRDNEGHVALDDPRILAARCLEDYPYWTVIQEWLVLINNYVNLGKSIIPGPYSLTANSDRIARIGKEMFPNASHDGLSQAVLDDPRFGLESLRQIWINSAH